MTQLKVSVAMCTYNGERHLGEQLDSIARQTRLPDELVVCDDNSADTTVQIIDTFAASVFFPVRIFRNPANIGSTRNFEQSIGVCGGDIIVLSDQDDVWHPDKLELIEQHFLDSPETGAVFSNGRVVSESLSPLGYTLWDAHRFKSQQKNCFRKGKALDVLLNHDVATGATMAIRSALRDLFIPIPGSWVHDAWIALLLSIYSRIDFIDMSLIDYRQHETQQIGSVKRNLNAKKELAQSIDSYLPQITNYELLLEHMQRLNKVCDDNVLSRIHDKMAHLKTRDLIYKSNLHDKIVSATLELLKRRYHNYANGYLSFFKDMLWDGRQNRVPKT